MTYIQLGNVTLQIEWGAVILALLLLMLADKLIYKKSSTPVQDSIFYYIIVWKCSYIIIDFRMFLENPMSSLYFNGGTIGHILGIVAAVFILLFKAKKYNDEIDLFEWLNSFLGFYLLFEASKYLLVGNWIIGTMLIVIYGFVSYAIKKHNNSDSSWLLMLILVNSILLAYEQKIFSVEGWTFVIIVIILLAVIVFQQKHLLKNVLTLLIVVILVSSVALNFEKANKTIALGKAVDFELETLAGDTVRLSDYIGKKVILNFWATWCPPCKAEMPHMQKFYEEHGDEVEVIAVNLTSRDNGREAIQSFINEYGLTFTIPLDADNVYGELYEVISIPTTYVIDENGDIIQKIIGPLDLNTLENL
nr:TlpA disulfide reductase family protein [Lysinibacillus timonensis]